MNELPQFEHYNFACIYYWQNINTGVISIDKFGFNNFIYENNIPINEILNKEWKLLFYFRIKLK